MPPTCHVPRKPVLASECSGVSAQSVAAHVERSDRFATNMTYETTVTCNTDPSDYAPSDCAAANVSNQQVMQALQVVLQQVNTNLRFTKAMYRGTKKSLVGPGYQFTRLHTNDSPFGTIKTPPLMQEKLDSSSQSAYPVLLGSPGNGRLTPKLENRDYTSNQSGLYAGVRSLCPIQQNSGKSGRDPPELPEHEPPYETEASEKLSSLSRTTSFMEVSEMVAKHDVYRKKTSVRIWNFLEDRHSSLGARYYVRARNALLALSILAACLEVFEDSVLALGGDNNGKTMVFVQGFTEFLFALELLLRFCSCSNRNTFFKSPHNIIDLVSVVPCALRIFVLASHDGSARILSLFGIVPVLRALKLLRHFDTFHLLLDAFLSAAESMPMILFTLFLIASGFAALIYYFEPRSSIPSFPTSLYFTIITVSTVGYGDFHPSSDVGRLLASLLAVIGPMYMSIPLWIIGRAFSEIWEDRSRLLILQRMRRCVANAGYTPIELKHMFKLLDENGDGSLDYKEFTHWLQAMDLMDLKSSDEFIQQLFDSFDADDEGTINFKELLRGLFPRTHLRVRQMANKELPNELISTVLRDQ